MSLKKQLKTSSLKLNKITIFLMLILDSTSVWAFDTNIGSSCGTVSCTAATQDDVTIDGNAASTALQKTTVWQGGVVNNNTILNLGILIVNEGGTANGTNVNDGNPIFTIRGINAKANNTTINGGSQYVTLGAVADSTIMNKGFQYVSKGSTAKNTVIQAKTTQYLSDADTVAENTTVYGMQHLSDGAFASGTKIYAGGQQQLFLSSKTIGTIIYGGKQHVAYSASAIDTVIYQDGQQSVYNKSVTTNTIIHSGGKQLMYEYSNAVNSTVNAGGYLQLDAKTKSTGGLNINGNGVTQITADTTRGAYIENISLNDQDSTLRFYNPGANGQVVTIDSMANMGIVTFQHPDNTGYTVANVKDLSGNGVFEMQVVGQTGDFLNVTDSVTGKHTIQLFDSGQDIDSTDYHLISATGSTDSNFALKNGEAELGSYRYQLLRDDAESPDNWYLRRSTLSHAAESVIAMANVTPSIWKSELTTLRARLGEIRNDAAVNHNTGVWLKGTSSRYDVSTHYVGYRQKTNGVVLGADRLFEVNNGQFLFGGMFSYSHSAIDYRTAGNGNVNSYSLGLYGTYLFNNGYYLDGVLKGNQFKTKNKVVTNSGNYLTGFDNTIGLGLSVEGGKHLTINDYFIDPYAMLSVFRGASTTYKLSNGFKTHADATKSLKGEAGLTFGKNFMLANSATIKPYIRLAISHEFENNNKLTLNDTEHFNNNMSGTMGKIGLGINGQLTNAWSAYAEINYANGNHVEVPYDSLLGIRYTF